MFFIVGICFLALLSVTLFMLWAHEKITNKRIVPHATVEDCWPNEDRREHRRFPDGVTVEYGIEKRPHLKGGKVVNMSKGGMKLLLDEKLSEGDIIDLKIYMPGKKDAAEVEAQVVWTKDAQTEDGSGKRFFHSGIKFIAIKESADNRITDYIRSCETSDT
jgi:c-di-GMP-binding flagellar brake protein YcgR